MSDLVANRADDEQATARSAERLTGWCARLEAWGIHPIFAEFTEPESFFTAFIDIEGPRGADIQNLLELTGIQQDLLDPVLGLVGSLGGMFTSSANSPNRAGRDRGGALMRPWN